MSVMSVMPVVMLALTMFGGSAKSQSVDWTDVHEILDVSTVTVVDGDTIKFTVGDKNVSVRLLGVDAPEIHGAKCERELELGLLAKKRAMELIAGAHNKQIVLMRATSGNRDKYGRVLAKVMIPADKGWTGELGDLLLRENLVIAYNGRTKRKDWCAE